MKGVLFGKISNLKNEVKLESMKTQTEFNFISIFQVSTVLCTPKRTKCSFPFYFSYLLVHSFRCCRMMGGAYDLTFSSNERMNLIFSLSSENFKTEFSCLLSWNCWNAAQQKACSIHIPDEKFKYQKQIVKLLEHGRKLEISSEISIIVASRF